MAERPLKLLARDAEDLAVISACLQDALVAPEGMEFDAASRRFVAIVDRFMHEAAREAAPLAMVRSGIRIEGVRVARRRGFEAGAREGVLELLAVIGERAEGDAQGDIIRLLFAGGPEIELAVDAILCGLEDLGPPAPARVKPHHSLD